MAANEPPAGWTAEILPQNPPNHHHYYVPPPQTPTFPSSSYPNPNPNPIVYASYPYPPDGVGFAPKEAVRHYGVDPFAYAGGEVPATHSNGLEQAVATPYSATQGLDWQLSPHFYQTMISRYPNDLQQTTPPPLNVIQGADWQLIPCPNQVMKKGVKKLSKIVQSAFCEVCKIECNSEEMLKNHKYGKKHKKNLEKLKESIMLNPPKPVVATPNVKQNNSSNHARKRTGADTEEDLKMKKMRVLTCGAAAEAVKTCTICNVVCNSEVVFNYHLSGQRHAAMLKKQKQS